MSGGPANCCQLGVVIKGDRTRLACYRVVSEGHEEVTICGYKHAAWRSQAFCNAVKGRARRNVAGRKTASTDQRNTCRREHKNRATCVLEHVNGAVATLLNGDGVMYAGVATIDDAYWRRGLNRRRRRCKTDDLRHRVRGHERSAAGIG